MPLYKKIDVEGLKIGLFHGSGIFPRGNRKGLFNIAKKLNVSILVSGHTHNTDITLYQGKLFLNPGSATGVWSGGGESNGPSYITVHIGEEDINIKETLLKEKVVKRYYKVDVPFTQLRKVI